MSYLAPIIEGWIFCTKVGVAVICGKFAFDTAKMIREVIIPKPQIKGLKKECKRLKRKNKKLQVEADERESRNTLKQTRGFKNRSQRKRKQQTSTANSRRKRAKRSQTIDGDSVFSEQDSEEDSETDDTDGSCSEALDDCTRKMSKTVSIIMDPFNLRNWSNNETSKTVSIIMDPFNLRNWSNNETNALNIARVMTLYANLFRSMQDGDDNDKP